MLSKNIETFIGCDAEYTDADIVLFGAPYDSTTSYRPGARFGGKVIRNESFGLESYSPYQDKDLTDKRIFDAGELELPFGDADRVLKSIEEQAGKILADQKFPLMIGGEHLVTLGGVRAAYQKYPDLHIIHFDAHVDLREDYLGVKLSHACVMRRAWELLGDGKIFQFGIRSGDREEFKWAQAGHVKTRCFDFAGLAEVVSKLRDKPIYLTVDLDVLDPSVFPGTGTPEAGGVNFIQLYEAIKVVCSGARLVAGDLTELCPVYDQTGVSTATACKLLRERLLML